MNAMWLILLGIALLVILIGLFCGALVIFLLSANDVLDY